MFLFKVTPLYQHALSKTSSIHLFLMVAFSKPLQLRCGGLSFWGWRQPHSSADSHHGPSSKIDTFHFTTDFVYSIGKVPCCNLCRENQKVDTKTKPALFILFLETEREREREKGTWDSMRESRCMGLRCIVTLFQRVLLQFHPCFFWGLRKEKQGIKKNNYFLKLNYNCLLVRVLIYGASLTKNKKNKNNTMTTEPLLDRGWW